MAMTMQQGGRRDDIDTIVDTLLEDPSRAEAMKKLLKEKIYTPKVVRLTTAKPVQDDADDLWDNVPV